MRPLALVDLLDNELAGRRVLVTGHSGFVGSWLIALLANHGADVVGFALPPEPGALGAYVDVGATNVIGDVRDATAVARVVAQHDPEYVFHLAAQPLVLESYREPVATLETNVLGTAHLLDSLRSTAALRSCVVVTSDKCYATGPTPHHEGDALGGDDPYSASKGAAELVAHAFRHAYFSDGAAGLATARAGNIVGGGDAAADRVIPDCVRALTSNTPVRIRRPGATRPWQHVLDAVGGYVRLAIALAGEPARFGRAWNFGPPPAFEASVGELVAAFASAWAREGGTPELEVAYEPVEDERERHVLTLDSSRAADELGWTPRLSFSEMIAWTARWHVDAAGRGDHGLAAMRDQLAAFLALDSATIAHHTGDGALR